MVKIVEKKGRKLTLQMDVELTGSLLEIENRILDACNEIGCLATEEALTFFDTDGSPIKLGETKLTSRCQSTATQSIKLHSINQ